MLLLLKIETAQRECPAGQRKEAEAHYFRLARRRVQREPVDRVHLPEQRRQIRRAGEIHNQFRKRAA